MGKKQHQKDKLYLTTTEWKEIGGHKDDTGTRLQRAQFKRLPLTHCALSLLPFEDPVCTRSGEIFDLTYIIPYLKKNGVNPCTGKKLSSKELIPLKFDKDEQGHFRCPVTFRQFTDHTYVVAIATTGNVFSYEAVQELNLKANHLKDLLTDTPFHRSDIIVLQDPNHIEKFNMEKFYHVQFDPKTKEQLEKEKKEMQDPKFYIRRMNNETKEALDQLKKEYTLKKIEPEPEETADEINAAHYSQGQVAAGFTSTTMAPITKQKAAVLSNEAVRYKRVKKNGYVRIITNHGSLNIELFCPKAPKTCENFILLCRRGYYNNSKFHRIIKNFMMQGGDPTGTGHGGESAWGKPFDDEFAPGLSHDARGILSMANKGTNTNQSQFFITFRPCKYLDKKHTIFGRVVGGQETLISIEKVETDGDMPKDPVYFMRAEVFVDPFEEAEAEVQKERASLLSKDAQKEADAKREAIAKPKAFTTGVGKYINPQNKRLASDGSPAAVMAKKKAVKSSLTDFSAW
ncbi:unnamed protein product [Cylicocyclus nassatus]|uniref:RING-type E3 ubiquitin-protein ligase PPIL2 n=1 Tax=Cylicocyclus nassatus TaxID=53992 RepID=A0AA36H820_CYLNA|nr:unnamed protein product [Cylicocyclus nassatus]